MKKWFYITLAIFCTLHLIRDYLQELQVRDWFATVGHFWDAPQYNVVGMVILMVVALWAMSKALQYDRVVPLGPDEDDENVGELASRLPRQSYAENGRPMEPVNLVLLGSKRELERAFRRHGWAVADSLTPLSGSKALYELANDRPYEREPVLPGLIGGRVQDFTFERETPERSARRRHHIRVWRTNLRFRGRRVWVATASFDVGAGLHPLPTHHIDPDLQREASYVRRSLRHTSDSLRLDRSRRIRNANGDLMEWNGRAIMINLSHSR